MSLAAFERGFIKAAFDYGIDVNAAKKLFSQAKGVIKYDPHASMVSGLAASTVPFGSMVYGGAKDSKNKAEGIPSDRKELSVMKNLAPNELKYGLAGAGIGGALGYGASYLKNTRFATPEHTLMGLLGLVAGSIPGSMYGASRGVKQFNTNLDKHLSEEKNES